MRLLALAIALILAEIAAFVIVGRWLGVLPVLTLVVLSGMVGLALMRTTGAAAAERVQAALQGRENPLAAAGSAAFRVVAGLLFLLPGFVSDVVALLLLLPPVQKAIVSRATRRAEAAVMAQVVGAMRRRGRGHDNVIEARAVEVAPSGPQDGRPSPGQGDAHDAPGDPRH